MSNAGSRGKKELDAREVQSTRSHLMAERGLSAQMDELKIGGTSDIVGEGLRPHEKGPVCDHGRVHAESNVWGMGGAALDGEKVRQRRPTAVVAKRWTHLFVTSGGRTTRPRFQNSCVFFLAKAAFSPEATV